MITRENMSHCYIVESQILTVLHILLQAVTIHKLLTMNALLSYINVKGRWWRVSIAGIPANPVSCVILFSIVASELSFH